MLEMHAERNVSNVGSLSPRERKRVANRVFFFFSSFFLFFFNLLQPRLTTNESEGEEKIDTGLKKKKKKKKSSLVSNLRHERTKGEILLQGHPT